MVPKADNQTGEGYLFNNQRKMCAVQGYLIEEGEEGSVRKGVTGGHEDQEEAEKCSGWLGYGAGLPVNRRCPESVSALGVLSGVWLVAEVCRQETCWMRDWRVWRNQH